MLGDPVHHSKSPEIQNAAFRAAGIDATYVALQVPEPRLEQALAGLHVAKVRGLNLTSPLKEAAFSLVRERTPDAEAAGAVNTLRWEPDGWSAHATDGAGFLAWIAEAKIDLSGRAVLMLGAGGAARAIVPKLLELAPESIQVVSRTAERAQALGRGVGDSGKTRVRTAALGEEPGVRWDLLVRALPVEAVSTDEGRWWQLHTPHAAVLDLNYGSRAGEARARANEDGVRYEDGGALLIHQGALSFEFWTGKKASLQVMREALRGVE